jgi:hypothetical protein
MAVLPGIQNTLIGEWITRILSFNKSPGFNGIQRFDSKPALMLFDPAVSP